jgi:dihydroflavonol-4-reductase
MQAFVTGSTGLLGNNLVRLLLAQGYQVRALVRSPQKAAKLFAGLNLQLIQGDMKDVGGFAAHLRGCDVLFHTAAYFQEYFNDGGDPSNLLETINVQGTIQLLSEAERQGVGKTIYVSSESVIGMKPDGQSGDESCPPDPRLAGNLYTQSKVRAEQAITQFLQDHSHSVVQILPGWMFGPADAGPTNAGNLVLDYLDRKFPGIVDGGQSVVDVREVAEAMISAVKRGHSGERYIVAGSYASMEDLFRTLEAVSGVPCPSRHIPYAAIVLIATITNTLARLRGLRAPMSMQGLRALNLKRHVSSEKAKRELGVRFRPLEETLHDTVQWYLTRSTEKELVSK